MTTVRAYKSWDICINEFYENSAPRKRGLSEPERYDLYEFLTAEGIRVVKASENRLSVRVSPSMNLIPERIMDDMGICYKIAR